MSNIKTHLKMETIKFQNVEPSHEVARDFDLKYERIKSVYYGRIDACTCGCEGQYFYTNHYAKYKSAVEGNRLLLPIADNEKVERQLKRALEHSHKAKFFKCMTGGYQIQVPTHIEEHSYEREVQMGFIIELHWKDISISNPQNKL